VVKEVQKLPTNSLNALAGYTASPVKTTCLVLAASGSGFKTTAYNTLKEKSISVEFKPLYDNQVPKWITEYVQQLGKDISPEATQLLHGFVGNSLLNLTNELEKIFLNLYERKRIEATDVQFVVGVDKEYNIFQLQSAVGNRRLDESLTILNRLLEHGEQPTGMVVRLTNYFTTLVKVIELRRRRKADNEIAKEAGVHFYFLNEYKQQAQNYNLQKIEKIFSLLLAADTHLKTGYQTPKLIMELLIYQIIQE
jgi:DNA polymerase III subunit delta